MLFPRAWRTVLPRVKEIFDKAGYDLDDDINKIGVVEAHIQRNIILQSIDVLLKP